MTDPAIAVRELHGAAEAAEAAVLLARVWRTAEPPLDAGTLVALAHAGDYVAGAFADGAMIGAAAGFFGPPAARTLHSHITGVLAAGRGVGSALKRHQRDWCLERGATTITWTFDPLVARNAHFNLVRLGARVTGYAADLYGPMSDGLNAGEPSDRLFVAWDLRATRTTDVVPPNPRAALDVDADGGPTQRAVREDARLVEVAIPKDIEALRQDRPEIAAAWRLAVREELGTRLDDGFSVLRFAESRYALTKEPG